MQKSNNREIIPMEDDEDLEFLRLAALKSLNNKKENVLPAKPLNNDNHIIPVVSGVRVPNDIFYAGAVPELIQPNIIHHPVPPYLNPTFDKLDICDQYIPQRLNPVSVGPFNEYTPFGTASVATIVGPSNVQLSPRSAAFVYQNNDILMRRKGGISPGSPRSHSPIAYRKSPGRWSPSPSPTKKMSSRSPKRSPSWGYRRSTSRSPIARRSPPYVHNRSHSRSPLRRRHSPLPQHIRRSKSRSPIPRNVYSGNNHRPVSSRSPNAHNGRRGGNNSPTNRNAAKPWRAHSPSHHRANGQNPLRNSISPRPDDSMNYRSTNRRRTRSPAPNTKPDLRKRSQSRSPSRKYQRNNNPNLRRRQTPLPRKINKPTTSNKINNTATRNRNYNTSRKSLSPTNPNRRTNSKSPLEQPKTLSVNTNNTERVNKPNEKEQESEKGNKNTEEANVKATTDKTVKTENDSKDNSCRTKTEQEIEDELLASTDDEKSDSDNDDDGIDLFASEESESENEGRFKLSSAKTERTTNVSTVSFSKLGISSTAPAEVLLRDLDDLRTEKGSTYRKDSASKRDNGKNVNSSRSAPYNRRDGRYNSKKSFAGNSRERDRERDLNRSSWKISKGSDTRKKENEPTAESSIDKNERKSIMFKSTFQAVDSESRTRTPDMDNEKHTETKEKLGTEKKNALQLKRPFSKIVEKDVLSHTEKNKGLQSSIGLATIEKQRTPPTNDISNSSGSGSSTAAKKPIHLRLGAMTKTWKTNKKPWRSEKV